MIGPKSMHLVERAAERLLQAGVLEGSAAQLLEPDRVRTSPAPFAPSISSRPSQAPPPLEVSAELLTPERPPSEQEAADEQHQIAERPIVDMAALERGGLFDWTHGRTRISEEFRLAQRQLLRAAFAPTAEAGLANLLMVTSARPGEGKSFTALNLACSVALQGDHHVLLIDSDSKRDSLGQALGLADAPGLL